MSTVGNYRGPNIVKDSLILYLEGTSPNSYSPYFTGTTWKDISTFNYNVTLINGPTYSSLNGGSIVFDGINDYGTIPYNSNFDLSSTNYTLEGWFNSNTFSGASGQSLISKDTFGVNFDWSLFILNSTTLCYYSNGTATSVTATVPTMATNQWYHYVITSISGTIRIYLNSVLYQTQAMSTSNSSQVSVTIGCYSWNNPAAFTNGRISTLRVYRKGLTISEIQQNYLAKFNQL